MRGQNEIVPSPITPLPLEARIQTVRDFLAEELEDNTKRAYTDDIRAWVKFCDARGYSAFPVDDVTIAEYVMHLVDDGKALKTIQRRVNGLRGAMKAAGQPLPDETLEAARRALKVARKRIMREPGTRGRGKAPAFTVSELRAISDACPDKLKGIRDRALVLLGFAIAARRSELAALRLDDITETDEGLVVHIRWSKVGEERWPKVLYGQNLATCPVRAWKAWVAAASITDGPAFRRVDRHSRVLGGLTPEGVGDAVTEAARRAGLEDRTAHGLRAGMATEARRAKHDAVA
ncbi:tyrosine-type recombinase/integrase, partial [Nonomuraea pusilla]